MMTEYNPYNPSDKTEQAQQLLAQAYDLQMTGKVDEAIPFI